MDLTAVRAEVASLVVGQVYAHLPGDAEAPCVIVGLSDEVRWLEGSYGITQVLLPVWAIGGRPYEPKSEATVMTLVDQLITTFRSNPNGSTYAALAVQNVDRIGTLPIGTGEFVGAAVNLLIHVRR